ncbi:MAG: ABC transporter permease [Rectinema subterraneum]|uniref:ABC transporter permease n=1 Tax=Rectinema subterraneum TaxID=2653714 RepID=UPI003C7B0495
MNLISYAWRNLLRNTRRSLLAVLSTFLATLLVVAGNGLTEGFLDSMVRNYAKNETGHVNITTSSYRDRARFLPIDDYIADADQLVSEIEQMDGAGAGTGAGAGPAYAGSGISAAPRIRFGILLSSGLFTKPAVAIAGDPEKEKSLLMLNRNILPGGSYCDEPGTAIIGSGLAKDLGLKPGDKLKIIATRADGGIGFKSLKVSGIFQTGTNALDGSIFQMRLDDAQNMLGMPGGAQQILVMLPDYRLADAWQKKIGAVLAAHGQGQLSVLPWSAIGDYPKLILMASSIYMAMWFFIALLGAFIIANIMTMVVLERRRETGILMAMGMPPRRIILSFLLEGTMMGFGGSVLGTAAGIAFNAAFSRKGFDLSSALAGFSWPIDTIIKPTISVSGVLAGILFCTVAAAIMSLLPSWRASRMEVADALKAVQ